MAALRVTRVPLLGAGLLALLAATAGGLVRLGVPLPVPAEWALIHGPLVATGFLGTLIGLERAIALGGIAWAVPLCTVASAGALIAGAPWPWPPLLALVASGAALAVFLRLLHRQRELFLAVMTLAVVAWLVANGLWYRDLPYHRVAPWWAAFFTLFIAGERLELTRLFPPSARARSLGVAAMALVLAGLVLALAVPDGGMRVAGAGLLVLAAWLARHDVARRNLRAGGLTGFMAAALLAGYAWLALAGAAWIGIGHAEAGVLYDAALHAVFLGFVFAMIFAHAPVIFPSVLGVRMRYSATFYGPLVLLQVTLALRLAGDLGGSPAVRRWGAVGNGLAIVLFLANTARVVLRPRAGES